MDRNAAISLDTEDPLASVRARFELPDDLIYLDGNSLGAPLQSVARGVTSVLDRWRDDLIGGWNAGWVHLAERAAVRVASVLGAQEHEVAVADSTSTNLFKALVAATGLRPERQVILMVEGEFPTDLYVASGLADLTGAGVRTVGRTELEEAVDQDVA
ncbi:MAG: hypothetical protein R3320_05820, partial [Nitriliruptorales bacterium]|nr:hypothetical protein [Nitriliruptorales bacterium]